MKQNMFAWITYKIYKLNKRPLQIMSFICVFLFQIYKKQVPLTFIMVQPLGIDKPADLP